MRFTYATPDLNTPPALDGVTLRIEAGEYVAIVGANGSGKSTLARHLNALLIPTAGTVAIAGMDTRERTQRLAIRQTVGMVFQRPDDQIIAATIEEDVAFGPENMGLPPDEIRARVRQALETVGLWEVR
ncbi:MAG TPA: ATP-binding cassette domain-containing protein, partial [Anaerolineae bacterium]|nr:ATP-binding cassette domain-containing protein [Anaerolineae bacterium]